jgi:hypothetical protein
MSWALATVAVPAATPRPDGVIRAADAGLLASAQAQAQALLAAAQNEAQALRQASMQEAERLRANALASAQADAQALTSQLQQQWEEALSLVPACALAVAQVAFERVSGQMDWQQRLQAAVAGAVQELPSPPVRLWLPQGAPEPLLPDTGPTDAAVQRRTESALAANTVAVEAGAITMLNDFNAARTSVHNELRAWLRSLVADGASAPSAPPDLPSSAP